MILETNFGMKIIDVNGIYLRVYIEKFLDEGRYMHIATCNWEPMIREKPSGNASTSLAMRQAVEGFESHDRNRLEKRVLKVAVWDMETDDEAKAVLQDFLQSSIVTR
jgi:hypothetical protein